MQDQDARLAAVAERTAQIARVLDAANKHCELIDPECKRVGEEFASNPDKVYHLKTAITESEYLDVQVSQPGQARGEPRSCREVKSHQS